MSADPTIQYTLVWDDAGTGASRDLGFYKPTLPAGYISIGDVAHNSHQKVYPKSIAAIKEDTTNYALPVDYVEIWNDKGAGAKHSDCSIWKPVPPPGFVAMGHVISRGYDKPPLNAVHCVTKDWVVPGDKWVLVWETSPKKKCQQVSIWWQVSPPEGALGCDGRFVAVQGHDKPSEPMHFFKSVHADRHTHVHGEMDEVYKDELETDNIVELASENTVSHDQGKIPPLNVVILIVGSRGDVQPFIAFGKGLKAQGHRVRIASHINFKNFVRDNGLEFYPLKGDPEVLMAFMVNHPNMLTLDPKEIKANKKMMRQIYRSAYWACTRGDGFKANVVISNPPVHVHVHLRERLQVPLHVMFTMPWSPTEDYRHPLSPFQHMGSNKGSYAVVDRMIWMGLGDMQNKVRQKVMGLPHIYRGASLLHRLKIPVLYCMSPHLAPKPRDWGPHVDVVGFWFLDLKSDFTPPKDLVDFCDAGPAPVYIGFGSIVVADPKKLSLNVIEGIKMSGQRAIVSSGWAKLGEGLELPPTIKVVGAVPHDWLFPHCSAVCHHGGAGTTAAGLRAGLPTIIVPFFGDQPFWGSCVARMGVGPTPIPHAELTKEKLSEAILFCTKPEVKAAAQELGKKLRDEDGVQAAVDAFHRKLPVQQGVWTDSYHENQRYLAGWHGQMLPGDPKHTSDKTGIMELKPERFECPAGWEWDGNWQPDVTPETDSEGWKYAVSFNFGASFHPSNAAMDAVRTRKMIRKRKYVGLPPPATLTLQQRTFTIYVDVIEAKEIPKMDLVGESDPYCKLWINADKEHMQKTKVIPDNPNPVWKETMWFEVNWNDTLNIECLDWDTVSGSDTIGNVELMVSKMFVGDKPVKDIWVTLSKGKGQLHLGFSL